MTDNSRWESLISKATSLQDNPSAQNEVSELLLDFDHFLEFGSEDSRKYEIINLWTKLKEASPKWDLGPLYAEGATRYLTRVNERISASPADPPAPARKYEAAAALLAVSKTLRLSSPQSDALTIGTQALAVFLQIPSPSPITNPHVDLATLLRDDDLLTKASDYHTLYPPWATPKTYPHLTDFISNAGDILRNLGKLELSGECYKKTLAIRVAQCGDHHPDVAASLNLVGNILRETGKLEEASGYYQRSLAIREEVFGPNSNIVGALLNDIGILQCSQGKLEEGKKTHQRALAIRTELLGPEHPNVANSWNNLGTIFRDLGEFEEARRCYENALAIRRKHFGEVHPHVGFTLNNMGVLLLRKGDLEEAATCHRKALAIRKELFGEKHPDVVLSLNNLGAVLKEQGKEEEADKCLEEARAIKATL